METTQTEPTVHPKRKFPVWQVVVGLTLSLGAFLFGGFMAAPAALAVVPGLRRFWPLAAALFVGVLGVRGLVLAGVDPAVDYAREMAIAEMRRTLGADISFESFEGDAVSGRLKFYGVRSELPEVGAVELNELEIFAGFALMFRPDGFELRGRGLNLNANLEDEKLQDYLNAREASDNVHASLYIEEGNVALEGESFSVDVELDVVQGSISPDGWELRVGVSRADVTVMGRTHKLQLRGGVVVEDSGGGVRLKPDILVSEPELGRGVARGELSPNGDGTIVFTLDWLELNPLWARYRKVDQYLGTARGQIAVRGSLTAPTFEFDLHVREYEYYHRTFMNFDESRKFRIPDADVTGRITVDDDVVFEDVTINAPEMTLATDPKMTATGSGRAVLNGVYPRLKASLDATVTGGEIRQPVTWNPNRRDGLKDIAPNLITVGEQFPELEVDWKVDVQSLTVNCQPLSGQLEGKLNGTLRKGAGRTVGELRVDGELIINDGRVEFLGLSGDVGGRVIFNSNSPSYRANLDARISANVGEMPVTAEIAGTVMRPVFTFTGVTMRPDLLGRKIVEHSNAPLTNAQKLAREEALPQLCGPTAVAQTNPFAAQKTGKVTFTFKP